MALSDEDKKMREGIITGSRIAELVYGDPMKVYEDMVLKVEKPTTEAMRIGRAMEPAILNLYQEQTGATIREACTLIHPEYSFIGATPDAYAIFPNEERVVEAKWTGFYNLDDEVGFGHEEGTDSIPRRYLAQTHFEMAVSGLRRADVPVYIDGARYNRFRIYHVEFDDTYFDLLLEIAARFYNEHYLPKKPPFGRGGGASERVLSAIHPKEEQGKIITATPDIEELLAQIAKANAEADVARKGAEAIIARAEEQIALFMGDAEKLVSQTYGYVTWKLKNGYPSWKGVAEELGATPEIIAKHTSPPKRYMSTANVKLPGAKPKKK